MNLGSFRSKLREYRRQTGYSQQDLAAEVGLHHTVLSAKLNGTNDAKLTHPEVKKIILVLTAWEAITNRQEAYELLELTGLKPTSFSEQDWRERPLSLLTAAPPNSTTAPIAPPVASSLPEVGSFSKQPLLHNLPAQPTPLIGRRQEIGLVRQLLQRVEVRLLTLSGPGGIGKSRLASAVASELLLDFEDGVFFVALAAVYEPGQVASAIAQALNLKETKGQSALETLKNYLAERRLLLVLDNFEQIVEAAPLLADLLATSPNLKIMLTSRVLLHLYGEHEFGVPPLGLPIPQPDQPRPTLQTLLSYEAVQLFLQRARAVDPTFQLTNQNAGTVSEICAELDGIPLAIELAAARTKLFSPTTLLSRLTGDQQSGRSARLSLLAGGPQNVPAHQRTLRSTLEWSYNLLSAQEKQLFTQLAVFVGGFTYEAADAILEYTAEGPESGSDDVMDGLVSLLDKSMLRRQAAERANDEPRFGMLETLREYALERCDPALAERVATRHRAYYLTLAEQADPHLDGAEQLYWIARLQAETANYRAVLGRLLADHASPAEMSQGLNLIGVLYYYWHLRGHFTEGRRWLELALRRASEIGFDDLKVLARLHMGSGSMALSQGDYQEARQSYEQALDIRQAQGDQKAVASIYNNLALVFNEQGDLEKSKEIHLQSLAIRQEIGDWRSVAISFNNLGIISKRLQDFDQSRQYYEQCLQIRRELRDIRGTASVMINLGVLAKTQGDLEAASTYLHEALGLWQEIGEPEALANVLGNLAVVAIAQARWDAARPLLLQCLLMQQELGSRRGIGETFLNLGHLARGMENYPAARLFLRQAHTLLEENGNKHELAECQQTLAALPVASPDHMPFRLPGLVRTLPGPAFEPLEAAQPSLDRVIKYALEEYI